MLSKLSSSLVHELNTRLLDHPDRSALLAIIPWATDRTVLTAIKVMQRHAITHPLVKPTLAPAKFSPIPP